MELQEFLDSTGYTQALKDLAEMIVERDRFADILRRAGPSHVDTGRKALAALDHTIDATSSALADEYERAVKFINTVYATKNGVALTNDLIPRLIAELDSSNSDKNANSRTLLQPRISH